MDEITRLQAEAHRKNMALGALQKQYQEDVKAYNEFIAKITELEASHEA